MTSTNDKIYISLFPMYFMVTGQQTIGETVQVLSPEYNDIDSDYIYEASRDFARGSAQDIINECYTAADHLSFIAGGDYGN